MFAGSGLPAATLSDAAVGGILLVSSLTAMVGCLLVLVRVLSSVLRGPLRRLVRRAVNSDLPGHAAALTGPAAMLVGAGVTVLVQSSSVFTSALTPLVGLGVVTVERVYPLTLGANLGTTVTGTLAALTADPARVHDTLQLALCHLAFNVTGTHHRRGYLDTLLASQTARKASPPIYSQSRNRKMAHCLS